MLANTVRAICAVPIVTTFVVGALVLTSLGWWLLSVLVFDGAPNPRNRPMAKNKADTGADSLEFVQPTSSRGRKGASPDVCQIARYVAKNAPDDTTGVLKVKIGDKALAELGINLGTRSNPAKVKLEGAFGNGKLYLRQSDSGGWTLGKAHNAMRAPAFGQVSVTGDLAERVFKYAGSALNGSSVEVTWSVTKATDGSLLVLEIPTKPE